MHICIFILYILPAIIHIHIYTHTYVCMYAYLYIYTIHIVSSKIALFFFFNSRLRSLREQNIPYREQYITHREQHILALRQLKPTLVKNGTDSEKCSL